MAQFGYGGLSISLLLIISDAENGKLESSLHGACPIWEGTKVS